MTTETVVEICTEALYTVIQVAAPPLLASLIVGLVVSIFQTITSIQEQTLTFVPKLLVVFLVLIIGGDWMLNSMSGFMEELWADFSVYIR